MALASVLSTAVPESVFGPRRCRSANIVLDTSTTANGQEFSGTYSPTVGGQLECHRIGSAYLTRWWPICRTCTSTVIPMSIDCFAGMGTHSWPRRNGRCWLHRYSSANAKRTSQVVPDAPGTECHLTRGETCCIAGPRTTSLGLRRQKPSTKTSFSPTRRSKLTPLLYQDGKFPPSRRHACATFWLWQDPAIQSLLLLLLLLLLPPDNLPS